jgi:hypothetical protein
MHNQGPNEKAGPPPGTGPNNRNNGSVPPALPHASRRVAAAILRRSPSMAVECPPPGWRSVREWLSMDSASGMLAQVLNASGMPTESCPLSLAARGEVLLRHTGALLRIVARYAHGLLIVVLRPLAEVAQ